MRLDLSDVITATFSNRFLFFFGPTAKASRNESLRSHF
jgi:hypothetical protein